MAYVSQDLKASLAPTIKAILKKYNVKGSLSVCGHSTLVLKIKSGPIDFFESYNRIAGQRQFGNRIVQDEMGVNVYWYKDHFDGVALAFLSEIVPAMNAGNHDNSDIMTDYFDVGWYVDIEIGTWNKPYILEK